MQETDYLGVVNHFYDSDAEDDEEEESESAKMEALTAQLELQRNRKLTELRREKADFVPGLWNAQSVLLGGLGRDPNVEDDGEVSRIRSAIEKEVLAAQSKKKHLTQLVKERVRSGGRGGVNSVYGGGAASQLSPRTAATSSRGRDATTTYASRLQSTALPSDGVSVSTLFCTISFQLLNQIHYFY